MSKRYIFISIIAILIIINFQIYQKEQLIKNGKTILLKLAPIDPRSLMQGDYMALRFEIERFLLKSSNSQGVVYLKIDIHNMSN